MLELGGLCFEVGPEGLLTLAERDVLQRLGATTERTSPVSRLFRVTVVDAAPPRWAAGTPPALEGEPAVVSAGAGDQLWLRHARFSAEVDPFSGSATLLRRTQMGFPLSLTLRVALAARLPVVGGVPIHAAGLVIDGQGMIFFGRSGAGKSTLASTSKDLVLSDELVAMREAGDTFVLASTGIWGTLDRGGAWPGCFPARALIALAKGPSFRLDRLSQSEALRPLLAVTMVPPSPRLWNAALDVLARMVRRIPVYRMEWSADSPPWSDLREALDADARSLPRE